jgi:replicative superfamily II helicase
MDNNKILDSLENIVKEPGFKDDIKDYFDKLEKERKEAKKKQNFLSKRLRKRFKGDKKKFSNFIQLFEKKYNSKEYVRKWYSKGLEPPEDMYWNLFEYAKKYGRKCSKKEIEKYGNIFTSSIYYCQGYYFQIMDGQGSAVIITKKK